MQTVTASIVNVSGLDEIAVEGLVWRHVEEKRAARSADLGLLW
jgi:hypothetical protein